jgi:dihydroneopterin aldolase
MRLESGFIYIKNLRFRAYHGALEQEKLTGNDYVVNVRVGYPMADALEKDDLDGTVNYATLFEIVKKEMQVASSLIENVAYRIARSVFENFPKAESIDIDISKLNPPMGADCDGAGVELHLINDKTI